MKYDKFFYWPSMWSTQSHFLASFLFIPLTEEYLVPITAVALTTHLSAFSTQNQALITRSSTISAQPWAQFLAQTVRDSSCSYKIDYVLGIKTFLNPERHHWFKSYGHFTEGVDFAYLWSFSGGGSAISFDCRHTGCSRWFSRTFNVTRVPDHSKTVSFTIQPT